MEINQIEKANLMKNNVLFLFMCLYSMSTFSQNPTHTLNSNGISILYDITGENGGDNWNFNEHREGFHQGDDYYAQDINKGNECDDLGQSIYAGIEGKILSVRKIYEKENGNALGSRVSIINTDPTTNKSFVLMYSHLDEFFVKKDDFVKKGDVIGTIGGSSSNREKDVHLHLSMYKDLNNIHLTNLKNDNQPNLDWTSPTATEQAAQFSTTERESISNDPIGPTLTVPSLNAEYVNKQNPLEWLATPNATSYEVQISTSPKFNLLTGFAAPLVSRITTSTQIVVNELQHDKVYYWSVKTVFENGSSIYSPMRKFTTRSDRNYVKVVSDKCINNFDMTLGLLDWEVYSGVTQYRIQISTKPDWDPISGFTSGIVENIISNFYSAHRPIKVEGQTTYYWTVRGDQGVTTQYSPVRSFTTGVDPRPNIFGTDLRIFDESDTNEITEANIGEYINVKFNHHVDQENFQGLGSYINFYISTNEILDNWDTSIGTKHVNITDNSAPTLINSKLRIPGYTPHGNVYLIIKLDSQKVHQETNEDDNLIIIPLILEKVKPFIVVQSPSTITVEFFAPFYANIRVVMRQQGSPYVFSRTTQGRYKFIRASRCNINGPFGFSTSGSLPVSLYRTIDRYNNQHLGTEVISLIPINDNCEVVSTQSARQSTIISKTSLDVPTPELMEVQVVNLFNPTNQIKKTVDKSTFDLKSLNLPSGFYVIRFADGTSKKVYLQ